MTNPSTAGDYVFGATITSISDVPVARQSTLTIPGSVTPTGTDVTSDLGGSVSVTFSEVTGEGVTSRTTQTDPPPEGTGQFQLPEGFYYDLSTTTTFSCPCTITLPYDPDTNPNPRMYHLENGVWVDVTTDVDTLNHTVTGIVSSFSLFALGTPNFGVDWNEPISDKLAKKGNPFPLEDDENLGIKFNLLDQDNQLVTTDNVAVEIWQTKDEIGATITPTKVLTLTPELNEKKSRYQAELDLEQTPLGLGTYEIRVRVSNTTASQSPQIASFTVVPEDDDSGTSVLISSGESED